MAETSWVHCLNLKFFTHWKCCGLKNNSSINICNTNNNQMRKSNFLTRQSHFWCVFLIRSSNNCCSLKNSNAKFHKVVYRHYSGKVKAFTLLYGEFTQDKSHQTLLGSAGFRLRYDNKCAFFWFTVYVSKLSRLLGCLTVTLCCGARYPPCVTAQFWLV